MTKEELANFLYEALIEQAQNCLDGDGFIAVPEGPISGKIAWDVVTVRGVFDFLALAEAIIAVLSPPLAHGEASEVRDDRETKRG